MPIAGSCQPAILFTAGQADLSCRVIYAVHLFVSAILLFSSHMWMSTPVQNLKKIIPRQLVVLHASTIMETLVSHTSHGLTMFIGLCLLESRNCTTVCLETREIAWATQLAYNIFKRDWSNLWIIGWTNPIGYSLLWCRHQRIYLVYVKRYEHFKI